MNNSKLNIKNCPVRKYPWGAKLIINKGLL